MLEQLYMVFWRNHQLPSSARWREQVPSRYWDISTKTTMGTGSFLGVKRLRRDANHPPPSKRRGHERVELYLYSSSRPSWSVIGRTSTLPLPTKTHGVTPQKIMYYRC